MKLYLLKLWIGSLLASELIFLLVYSRQNHPFTNDPENGYKHILLAWQLLFIFFLSVGTIPMFFNLIPLIVLYTEISPIPANGHKIQIMIPLIIIFFICLIVIYTLYFKYLKKYQITNTRKTT